MKRLNRALLVSLLLVSMAFATPSLVSQRVAAFPVALAPQDATGDSVNATVATVTALFLALIPLIIMINVMSGVIGMFIGRLSGMGGKKYQ